MVLSLHAELSARFPEIAANLDDCRELPYLQMHELGRWIASLNSTQISSGVIDRVTSFAAWCEVQSRSDDAGTDIYTIFVVGLLEKLFAKESSRSLLPHLIPKQHIVENAEYLRRWVGKENYEAALALYPART
jgi:hypothetical protein